MQTTTHGIALIRALTLVLKFQHVILAGGQRGAAHPEIAEETNCGGSRVQAGLRDIPPTQDTFATDRVRFA